LETASRSNNFDLIRLFAAVQVVFVHAVGHTPVLASHPPWLQSLFDVVILFPGVAIFFVISGFLIPRSYERLQDRPLAYFMHRGLRIYPALIVCLLVSLAVLGALGFLGPAVTNSPEFMAWLFGQLTCGQFYNPEFFRDFGVGVVNGALWTISVELQFYALVPLLHVISRRTRFGGLLLATSFLASFTAFCYVDVGANNALGFHHAPMAVKLLFITIIPHWWMFVLGILLQRHFERLRGILEGKFIYHFAAYGCFAAARQFLIGRDPSWFGWFYPGYLPERILLATMTLSAAFSMRDLSGRLLRGADLSYGIYIYHFIIINVMLELGWMDTLPAVAAVFVLSAAAGALSWFGIEKRALALKPRVDAAGMLIAAWLRQRK
jgi:peptidoglycan/LPS O-acetylase OafA/YrhL